MKLTHWLVSLVGILLVCAVQTTASTTWFIEDFEDMAGPLLRRWQVDSERGGASVKRPGGWQLLEMDFSSGEYRTIRPYLRINTGTGTMLFDNLTIDDLQITNADFEQAQGNRLSGWDQDDVGDTIFWLPAVGQGRGCLRTTRTTSGLSRVWQDVPCEPYTDYTLGVWAKSENLQGTAYAEVYGIKPGGGLGDNLGGTVREEGQVGLHGQRVLSLDPRGGTVAISRSVTTPRAVFLRIQAWVNTRKLPDGEVRLTVAGQTSAEQLASVTVDAAKSYWQCLGINFLPPTDRRVVVTVSCTASRGTALVDNVAVTSPQLPVTPQQVQWLPADQWLYLQQGQTLRLQGPGGELLARGEEILTKAVQARWEESSQQPVDSGPPVTPHLSYQIGRN